MSSDCIHKTVLRNGCLLYAFLERWPVCGYDKCNFGCTISHELSVNDFHLKPMDWFFIDSFLLRNEMHSAMATCLILMFGRIGGVGGSNFVGLLLDVNCDLIFFLYSGLILSELHIYLILLSKYYNYYYSLINRLRSHMLLPEHKSERLTKDRGESGEMWGVIVSKPRWFLCYNLKIRHICVHSINWNHQITQLLLQIYT